MLKKDWRLKKYGNWDVRKLSGTTRKLFKKWGHRKEEISKYESQNKRR